MCPSIFYCLFQALLYGSLNTTHYKSVDKTSADHIIKTVKIEPSSKTIAIYSNQRLEGVIKMVFLETFILKPLQVIDYNQEV